MKKSYRAIRMERHHKRFGAGGLNLVALMDIFTILVFFLLVNSSSVQQLPNSKSVKLPESLAQQLPKENLIILVNNQSIYVQGRLIVDVSQVMSGDQGIIPQLLKEMQLQASHKAALLLAGQAEAGSGATLENSGLEVTIMGDQAIPYALLRKILTTLTQANYTRISMAVAKKSEQTSAQGRG